jgi:hypothetical protein
MLDAKILISSSVSSKTDDPVKSRETGDKVKSFKFKARKS